MNGVTSEPFSPLAILEAELAEMGERIAELEKDQAGLWVAPESLSPKLESGASVLLRKENGSNIVRFKGIARSGEVIPQYTTLFILPIGYRPIETCFMPYSNASSTTVIMLDIEANGVVTTRAEVPVGDYISFAGVTFQLN